MGLPGQRTPLREVQTRRRQDLQEAAAHPLRKCPTNARVAGASAASAHSQVTDSAERANAAWCQELVASVEGPVEMHQM